MVITLAAALQRENFLVSVVTDERRIADHLRASQFHWAPHSQRECSEDPLDLWYIPTYVAMPLSAAATTNQLDPDLTPRGLFPTLAPCYAALSCPTSYPGVRPCYASTCPCRIGSGVLRVTNPEERIYLRPPRGSIPAPKLERLPASHTSEPGIRPSVASTVAPILSPPDSPGLRSSSSGMGPYLGRPARAHTHSLAAPSGTSTPTDMDLERQASKATIQSLPTGSQRLVGPLTPVLGETDRPANERLNDALLQRLAHLVDPAKKLEWSDIVHPPPPSNDEEKDEMKRQNMLYELCYYHASFVADLRLLRTALLPALESGVVPSGSSPPGEVSRTTTSTSLDSVTSKATARLSAASPIIASSLSSAMHSPSPTSFGPSRSAQRSNWAMQMMARTDDLLKVTEPFIQKLQARILASGESGYITSVGDLLLEYVANEPLWSAVLRYITLYPMATTMFSLEKVRNLRFSDLVDQIEARVEGMKRRSVGSFVDRVRSTFVQYPLLARAPLKYTRSNFLLSDDEARTEVLVMERALQILGELVERMNTDVIPPETERANAYKLHHTLLWKANPSIGDAMMIQTLGLNRPNRRLVLDTPVYSLIPSSRDLRLVVTDSYFLLLEVVEVPLKVLFQQSGPPGDAPDPFGDNRRHDSDSASESHKVTGFRLSQRVRILTVAYLSLTILTHPSLSHWKRSSWAPSIRSPARSAQMRQDRLTDSPSGLAMWRAKLECCTRLQRRFEKKSRRLSSIASISARLR